MAETHGSPSHGSPSHGAAPHGHNHGHHEPEEDPLRTPGWMPLLGLALLIAGALGVYLFISPGIMSTSNAGADGGDVPADAAAH